MKNTIKLILATASVALLAACGGGGGGGVEDRKFKYGNDENITYVTNNGIKWSSPSLTTYVYSNRVLGDPDALNYCSASYKENINGPSFASNFNRELGWRLPTEAETQELISSNVIPQSWVGGNVWIQRDSRLISDADKINKLTLGSINLGSGVIQPSYVNSDDKARVVCVKSMS